MNDIDALVAKLEAFAEGRGELWASDAREAIAILREHAGSGWQPIESAPKDRSKIDVWAKHWLADSNSFIYKRFADVYWRKKDMQFSSWPDGWVNIDKGWYPTHWMPLPQPPQAEGE